jgi:hypothetical protein
MRLESEAIMAKLRRNYRSKTARERRVECARMLDELPENPWIMPGIVYKLID